jgi:hypothetical protein
MRVFDEYLASGGDQEKFHEWCLGWDERHGGDLDLPRPYVRAWNLGSLRNFHMNPWSVAIVLSLFFYACLVNSGLERLPRMRTAMASAGLECQQR